MAIDKSTLVELPAFTEVTQFNIGDLITIYDSLSTITKRRVMEFRGDYLRAMDSIGVPKYFHFKQCRKLDVKE
jgi:hypothetical protein